MTDLNKVLLSILLLVWIFSGIGVRVETRNEKCVQCGRNADKEDKQADGKSVIVAKRENRAANSGDNDSHSETTGKGIDGVALGNFLEKLTPDETENFEKPFAAEQADRIADDKNRNRLGASFGSEKKFPSGGNGNVIHYVILFVCGWGLGIASAIITRVIKK